MASFNQVTLMGNITRDLEVRYTPGGAAVCDIGLAVNRKYKQGDEWKEAVLFIDITTWGKTAENCGQYLSKGRPILVSGELVMDTWETDAGEKRSKIKVRANVVQFLNTGSNDNGGGNQGGGGNAGGGGGGGGYQGGGGNAGGNQGGGSVGGSKPDDNLDLDSIPF